MEICPTMTTPDENDTRFRQHGAAGSPGMADVRERLEARLREFFRKEQAAWEDEEGIPDSDLWDTMPTVDSKTVARTAPIFEDCLGKKLDVRLIRQGGYQSVEDVISDLVPKMLRQQGQDTEQEVGS